MEENHEVITDIQIQKIGRYVKLLKEWNNKINLISRKDVEGVWVNHIMLSLAFLFKVEFPKGSRVLDLGTGGGLPGIPLSILRNDVSFVLLDSITKKIKAVEEMTASLELQNVSVLCARAEDINSADPYHASFDAVIARGVSGLENLVAWGMPFLKRVGAPKRPPGASAKMDVSHAPALIFMKGGSVESEIDSSRRRFPREHIFSQNLAFHGSEQLQNSDKKLVIVQHIAR